MGHLKKYIVLSILGLIVACSPSENNEEEQGGVSQINTRALKTDRYCFSLDLKDDQELIQQYRTLHTPEGMWPEIPPGIKEAGCLDMEIYLIHKRMFLIVEINHGASLDSVWTQMGLKKRQDEWARFVRKFQQAIPNEDESSSWTLMEKVFDLDDYFLDNNMD
jgi:L-rhamnose mutarotase